MKSLSIAASLIACATTISAQGGPIEPCTFTATRCGPVVATATVTVFEQPGTVTATSSFDCHGCQDIVTENICGKGPVVPVTTVTDYAQETTTVNVCSPTPAV